MPKMDDALMRDTGCTRDQAAISRTFELVIRNRAKSIN
jgi:hypothetical protein